MSEAKHTPGPLEAEPQFIGDDVFTGTIQLWGGEDSEVLIAECVDMANARRLRDCWNACEGINPEAVPDLLAALQKLRDENRRLREAALTVIRRVERAGAQGWSMQQFLNDGSVRELVEALAESNNTKGGK